MYFKNIFYKLFKNNIKYNVIFLHFITTDNIGDLYCCPKTYFKEFKKCKEFEIKNSFFFGNENKTLIIGGGGLLQEYFEESIKSIIQHKGNNKLIFWGAGLDNTPDGRIFDTSVLKDADLIGIRDFNTQYNYVPCVSCMSKHFDKYRLKKPKTKIRCYINSAYDFPEFLINSFETYTNNQDYKRKNALEKAIKFLSEAEYIITNSFHGAYWATLLNRKVIVLPFSKDGNIKFSDKFLTLKYKPVYIDSFEGIENFLEEKLKEAKNYKDALKDARTRNIEFYKKVKSSL